MEMLCPKRCGGQEYTKVNRLVMNALNKVPFRCQFNPKCDKILNYENYSAHYRECPEGKPKPCENPDCQVKMAALVNRVNQLSEEIEQLQHYKERNAQIMKNQISDLKQQIKGGPEQDLGKVVMDQRARMSDYENRLVKAQQDLALAAGKGVAGKINATTCSQ